jgi:eukaryotic-like serine/threonine-protein kinase
MHSRLVLDSIVADKYQLIAELGSGAMGVVYRAKQLDLGRDVAIKLLHAGSTSKLDARLRFLREAKVATRLVHPAAVQILDFGQSNDQPYLVMELLEGETLRDRLNKARLSVADAYKVCRDVASALVAAHAVRLIHRDIKPENIFLQRGSDEETNSWRVRVVDFGLAFVADSDDQSVGRMTQEGVVGGTPAYMSPEQVHGRGIGPASDIYALGCVLFELLAHRPIFEGSLGDVLTRQAYAPPPDIMRVAPECGASAEVVSLLTKMLAKTAPLRPSPSHVVSVLQLAYDQLHLPATGRGKPMPSRADRGFAVAPHITSQPDTDDNIRVLLHGAPEPGLELALLSAGATVEQWAAPNRTSIDTKGSVLWAPGVNDELLATLCATGIAIVTDANDATMDVLIGKLRIGAADVVAAPYGSEAVARRLLRVAQQAVRRD